MAVRVRFPLRVQLHIYSIKPCTIVNGFGMDEIDSSFILTKAENKNFFSPIAVFDFDAEFDTTGEDLLN